MHAAVEGTEILVLTDKTRGTKNVKYADMSLQKKRCIKLFSTQKADNVCG